ncbi:MAG: hypothetical protein OXF54_20225 [Caldilineaceae bacterium]|nr:hypothetical protein [Caldilineaceae bacterium]
MLEITLEEFVTREYKLTSNQLEALLQETSTLSLAVESFKSARDRYALRPGSKVGALEVDGLSVLIKPKIEIPQLLSLASYATNKIDIRKESFDFEEAKSLPDILALALYRAARKAFSRGLLHGYQIEEGALHGVRGRIRFDEQIRRRFGILLPVELRFDEFSEDILANRLVKAAVARLSRMTLHSANARRGLGWIAAMLGSVSLLEFRRAGGPEVRFDWLNEHYRMVVGLARVILLHSEFESKRGDVRSSGFLVDMSKLFQEFLARALRDKLRVSERILRADKGLGKITLDEMGDVPLRPDLTWWEDSETCTFVGDAKYKDLSDKSVRNDDLYQILAYTTALNLPGGLLIYAQGGAETKSYTVRHAGKRLEVFALDLSCSLEDILARIETLACKIKSLRAEALDLKGSQ